MGHSITEMYLNGTIFFIHKPAVFHTGVHLILVQCYRDSKQPSYKIMTMKTFATQDKATPHTQSIRDLNFVAIRHMVSHMTMLPL